jgi:hypothetical protein
MLPVGRPVANTAGVDHYWLRLGELLGASSDFCSTLAAWMPGCFELAVRVISWALGASVTAPRSDV